MSVLNTALSSIPARDAMHGAVVACDPSTPASSVAALMGGRKIHAVVVEGIVADDEGERLVWGVITDLDLVRAVVLTDGDPAAETFASTDAVTVDATDDLATVARVLVEQGCSHAVVVDDERPIGVISTLDIARAVTAS
jgi:CBS domain-containing protein